MKALLVALAVLAGALSVADYASWRSSLQRLAAQAAESGLSTRRPGIEARMRRKANAARARILLARSLIALELDRRWLAELAVPERAEERRRGRERVALARQLAEDSLARQPVSWQAAMVLGAARFLEAARGRDRGLPVEAWRDPLRTAMRLAPGHPEPPRLLAATYLSAWSGLTPAERREVRPVLATAFRDPDSLDLLIGPWVRLAPSVDQMLAPMPDRPQAWQRLETEFRNLGDYERYGLAHERRHAATIASLRGRIEEGRDRLRGGHTRSAHRFFRAIVGTVPDLDAARAFSDALALLPQDVRDRRLQSDLERWFRWAIDLCLIGRCPLAPETIRDLSDRLDDLDEFDRAVVALAVGNLEGSRLPETDAGFADGSRWVRLLALRAERYLQQRQPDRAQAVLERVPLDRRGDPLFWRVRGLLAERAGDGPARAAARRRVAELSRREWSSGWLTSGKTYRLEVLPAADSPGLQIELAAVPEAGSAIAIRWDGRLRDVVAVQPRVPVRWRFPVTREVHLLEISDPVGSRLRPVAVTLEAAGPGR